MKKCVRMNDSEVMVGYILSPLTLNALFYKTRHVNSKKERERDIKSH